jgi:putative ABC transport system permease protein
VLWRGAGDLASSLRARTVDARVHRVQAVLVVAQVAAALTLVSGATLMARSVAGLLDVELGLDRSNVVVASVSLAPRPSAERRTSYLDLAERVGSLPGVARAGLISHLPMRDLGWSGPVLVEDRPELRDASAPFAHFRVTSPGALEAMGIELLRGRGFTTSDDASAEPVVLINRSFAETVWPGQDPLGRRIASIGFEGDLWAKVVGVVEDVRIDGPTWDAGAVFYRPLAQASAPAELVLVARVSGDSQPVAAALRHEAAAVDPLAAVHRVSTMDEVLRQAIRQPLQLRFFLTLLGSLALAVGSAGVFGMVSYAVGRKTREYGIRMALGADGRRLVRAELRRAAATVVLGGAIGAVASWLGARALASFLFGVGPGDPLSLSAAMVLLLGAGVGAALIPAARAGRVDPLRSLRAE